MQEWRKFVKAVGGLGRIPAVLLASVLCLSTMARLYPLAPTLPFQVLTVAFGLTVIGACWAAILGR